MADEAPREAAMSQANVGLVRRWFEGLAQGELSAIGYASPGRAKKAAGLERPDAAS